MYRIIVQRSALGTEQEDKQKSMREKGKIVHKIKRTEQEAMDRKQGERKGSARGRRID
jgi:hypothetical protein